MQSEWESKLTPSSCYWEAKNFDDVLENSLYCPYSSTEWDSIFASLINLLGDRNYRIRQQAIDCLKIALESERSQFSNDSDYTPKSIEERMRPIFEAIVSRSAITAEIFDYFCYEFQNELKLTEKLQYPSYEAIVSARILLYHSLNPLIDRFFSVYLIEIKAFDRIKILILLKSVLAGNYCY
jgi:hypothetical protein